MVVVMGTSLFPQLAQEIMPHLKDVHSSKSPFQLTTVLGVVKSCATSTVAKDMKPGTSMWDAIGDAAGHLIEESSKLLHPMSEAENVLKSELYPFLDHEGC